MLHLTVIGTTGDLVKIRPCGEEYDNKIYLGIFMGEVGIKPYIIYYSESQELELKTMLNPMIYIPELKKCVFGFESCWDKINSEEELKNITDKDINNIW